MKIILVRHGAAEIGKTDPRLTATGINMTRNSLMLLKKMTGSPDFIISSPLKRAVETANLVKEVFLYNEEIITDQNLSPGADLGELTALANSLEAEAVCFVGHNPDLSDFISRYISGSYAMVNLTPGSAALINFEGKAREASGKLLALIPAFRL